MDEIKISASIFFQKLMQKGLRSNNDQTEDRDRIYIHRTGISGSNSGDRVKTHMNGNSS